MLILSTDESVPQSSPVGRWRFCINQTIRNREAQSPPSLQQSTSTVPGLYPLSSKRLFSADFIQTWMMGMQNMDHIFNLFTWVFCAYENFHKHFLNVNTRPFLFNIYEKKKRGFFLRQVEFCALWDLVTTRYFHVISHLSLGFPVPFEFG